MTATTDNVDLGARVALLEIEVEVLNATLKNVIRERNRERTEKRALRSALNKIRYFTIKSYVDDEKQAMKAIAEAALTVHDGEPR